MENNRIAAAASTTGPLSLMEPLNDSQTLDDVNIRESSQSLPTIGNARPHEVEPRGVRQRSSLLSDAHVTDLLNKHFGKESIATPVRRHVSKCVEDLTKGVEKSLKLRKRVTDMTNVTTELKEGRVPAGIKPFKVVVDTPFMDKPIPQELMQVSFNMQEGVTLRECKERWYYQFIAMNKALDAHAMSLQVDSMKCDISRDGFVATCSKFADERQSAANELMNALCLDTAPAARQPSVPREQLMRLYDGVMEKVAENVRIEKDREAKKTESTAKKIEKLKSSAPQDLLTMKIEQTVKKVMKQPGAVKVDSSIDYGTAYSLVVTDNTEKLNTAIAQPPGLERASGASNKETGFQPRRSRGKQKPTGSTAKGSTNHKPKGSGKGKGKGKGKGNPAKGTPPQRKPKNAQAKSGAGKNAGGKGAGAGARNKGGKGRGKQN